MTMGSRTRAALAVICFAATACALKTPVALQRLIPRLKSFNQNKVVPKWSRATTKIETLRDRVTGRTERELAAEREQLLSEVSMLRESNAMVGRLQQKTAHELAETRLTADAQIASLKQKTLAELESTRASAEQRVETVRNKANQDLTAVRSEARLEIDTVADRAALSDPRQQRQEHGWRWRLLWIW